MRRKLRCGLGWLGLLGTVTGSAAAPAVDGTPEAAAPVCARLNGIEVACDPHTGGLRSLDLPGVGRVLEADPAEAGGLDLACPRPEFEPLRLAPAFSTGATFARSPGRLAVHWPTLGASRRFARPGGRVAATLVFEAAPDGRSLVLHCRVANNSDAVIRQVLFPDLAGWLPWAGVEGVEFRGENLRLKPFIELAAPTNDYFYAVNRVFRSWPRRQQTTPPPPRWFGLSDGEGGCVWCPRDEPDGALSALMLHLRERSGHLRLMGAHEVVLEPGQTWASRKWWLTPFRGGYSNGLAALPRGLVAAAAARSGSSEGTAPAAARIEVSAADGPSSAEPRTGHPRTHRDTWGLKLNGARLSLDRKTGGLTRLALPAPGPGVLLDALPAEAGGVQALLVSPGGQATRLDSRHGRTVHLSRDGEVAAVRWTRLGSDAAGDDEQTAGAVTATITFAPAPDGQGLRLRCVLTNHHQGTLRKVVFPDLAGLMPGWNPARVEFRSGAQRVRPFRKLPLTPGAPGDTAPAGATFRSGGVNSRDMIIRWLDLGTLAGGVSLYPRRWGNDPRAVVHLERRARPNRLRLACVHTVSVPPGATWDSGVYELTPHAGGWARGIGSYRQWARDHLAGREWQPPEAVRTDIGFRTLWLCRNQPADPRDAVWRFRDLPAAAREAREHGLHELVFWASHPGFELPLPPFYKHLGGEMELRRAVAACRELGVNPVPFISVCQARLAGAGKYRLTGPRGGWTYHPELVPRFNPPYASAYACVQISTHDPVWQREVLAAADRLLTTGLPSLCWDQFFLEPPEPNLLTLTRRIRERARRVDPQASFSAEELDNLELSAAYLDYTWNWEMNRDLQPVTSVFPFPRINVNIDASPAEVKLYFLRNRYLNIQPRRPDDINGSDWIRHHPGLSRALKQCARLRARFLPWFQEATLVGDCVLREREPGIAVAGYVRPTGLLVLVLNLNTAPCQPRLACDLAPWLPADATGLRLRRYNEEGELVIDQPGPVGIRRLELGTLDPLELAVLEIRANTPTSALPIPPKPAQTTPDTDRSSL